MENSIDTRAREIIDDFLSRQIKRRKTEEKWLLNINFLMGNQNVFVASNGDIREAEKLFSYESREVFNHIAPIIESRLAKLSKVRPFVTVRPSSDSEKDKEVAKISSAVLSAEFDRMNLPKLIKDATLLSEVTGTAFYKITHNGDTEISVVSPFEIFPESDEYTEIEDNPSIIHAKNIDVKLAESIYNLSGLVGEEKSCVTLSGHGLSPEVTIPNLVTVIERYTRPNGEHPNGLLEIVVGGKLVYSGGNSEYPFVKQVSNCSVGSFWGKSVIERCIPVQKAYNAVKNRKLEYIARLSAGVLAVEEGSVDLDSLESEGLAPGKILVYRSGSASPRFMDGFSVPSELNREEDRLLEELNTLAGVSDLMRSSVLPSNVTSGTAINQLTEADDTRLSVSAEFIRDSALKIAKIVLKTLKKHTSGQAISKIFDDKGAVEVFYWNSSNLKSDDLVLDTVNELSESVASRKNTALELFKLGLFTGENGVMDSRAKAKILNILGFGNFESGQDDTDLHIKRAKKENIEESVPMVLEVDDHDIHIAEHTRFVVGNENLSHEKIDLLIDHIRTHKKFQGIGE